MIKNNKVYSAILACVVVFGVSAGFSGSAFAQVACVAANVNNQVDPTPAVAGVTPINAGHIFCGNVNGNHNSTGFHSRPGGGNPPTAVNVGAVVPVGAPAGIYRLTGITITEANVAGNQKPLSTMYPDHCTQQNVLDAIRHAVANPTAAGIGPSGATCQTNAGNDFDIRFHVNGGTVVTAFPNY